MKKPTLILFIRRKIIRPEFIVLLFLLSAKLWLPNFSVFALGAVNPLAGRKIVIDPGHGGIDGGANDRDFLEKDINLAVAKKLHQELSKSGAIVTLTRKEDTALDQLSSDDSSRHRRDLNARVAIIEKDQPDIFLSIHVNANRHKPASSGSMVFYNKQVLNTEALADAIQTRLNKVTEKHGLKKHQQQPAGYFLLKNTTHTGAIIELGFMTNQRDKKLLKQGQYQSELTRGIVEGLKEYFSTADRNNLINKPEKPDRNNRSEEAAGRLYFPSKTTDQLGWELMETKRVTGASGSTEALVSTAVTALIKGPKNKDLLPVLDRQTRIRGLTITDGIVEIDFSKEIMNIPAESYTEYLAVTSLVETVTQFRDIRGIKILVEGRQVDTFAGHMDLSKVLAPQKPRAVIALVIDDLAGGEAGRRELMALKRPLTLAVMPGKDKSTKIAEEAFQKGYQVFLHIPMEPEQGKPEWLGPGAIVTGMSAQMVRKTFLDDLRDVPHAVGINNHMGSKVTKQEDIMREILTVAKQNNLLVLDSRTTEQSVIPKIANELDIPVVKRDVFLDGINSTAHVKNQIRRLAKLAIAKGSAIGIGHVGITGKSTVQGIKEMLPWLEDQGIELVFVSDLSV